MNAVEVTDSSSNSLSPNPSSAYLGLNNSWYRLVINIRLNQHDNMQSCLLLVPKRIAAALAVLVMYGVVVVCGTTP